MNPWGASNMGSGNDWEQQINAYISNLMRPRNQVAEYQAGVANTSQNPGMYYQQLQIPAQQAAERMRNIQEGIQAAQAEKTRAEASLINQQATTEGIRNSEEWTGGTSLLSPGRMSHPFMAMGGGGGGGGGRSGGGVPEMSFAEEEAKREKALAETRKYQAYDPYDTGYYSKGGGLTSYTYPTSPSYDPSTSSYGPSGGSDNSWTPPSYMAGW